MKILLWILAAYFVIGLIVAFTVVRDTASSSYRWLVVLVWPKLWIR